jgi:hypothetical protein
MTSASLPCRLSHALPLAATLVFLLLGLRLIAVTPFPAPDELQHVSYAAALQESGRVLPRFEAQRTLQQDDFTRWTARPNYIGHPSPFYLLESRLLNRGVPSMQAVVPLRMAALVLVCCGVWFMLSRAAADLADDSWACVMVCAAGALCPRLLGAASQATNDSLAVLGGALAFYGAFAPRGRLAELVAGCGLLLALWAKPNAGLEVALFLAFTAVMQRLPLLKLPYAWLAGGLIGVIPYLLIVARYGAIVPVTAESLGEFRHMPDIFRYAPAFLIRIGQTWGHLRLIPYPVESVADWITIVLFWAMIACTALAVQGVMRRPDVPGAAVAAAAPLALLAMLPVHFWFAATHLGYSLPAASFRYYLALWPGLAYSLGFAIRGSTNRLTRLGISGIAAGALAAGWAC